MLTAAALALPATASAQVGVDAPGINDHETLNYNGIGSAEVYTYPSFTPSRIAVGPYSGSFVRGTGTTSSFSIYCVDYENSPFTGPDNPHKVRTTSLGGAMDDGDLGNTRLGNLSGTFAPSERLGRYRQAAYLSSLFGSWASFNNGGALTKTQVWGALHAAIWNTVLPGFGGFADADSDTGGLATNFTTMGKDFDGKGWYVLTATTDEGELAPFQEFLVRVPEPSTYMLLGTGFLLMVGVSRKRFSEGQDAA
jgi:hypothetical protein